MKLQLNNLKNMRNSLARIIRMTADGKLEQDLMKTLTYGISHLLAIQKHQDDIRIEERLDDIEQRLKGAGK